MCGIAGVLRGRGRSADRTTVEAMAARLSHRGPDDRGTFVHRAVGLAAARLSIVDLTDKGAQPFRDETAALVFNGEIYNAATLGRRLEGEGVAFRGGSDTEVLFHALRRWGVEATLPALEGMFAFAFADLARQEVSLCRDRLGIKPLVWTEHDGDLAWASEAKALAVVRPLTADPVQSLFGVVGRVERSRTRTAFADVEQVPPGCWLRAAAGGAPAVRSWWNLAEQVDEAYYRELDSLDPPDLTDRFEALLQDSVQEMCRSDAPTGAFVSGGVDSSLLAALAMQSDVPPALFAADVGGPASELNAARTLARDLGRPLDVTRFPPAALIEDWAAATWHLEAPLVTHLNALPFGRLARRAGQLGVKAVLTGEGADELFFGYRESVVAHYRRPLGCPGQARSWIARRLPRPLRSTVTRSDQADFLVDLVGQFQHDRLNDSGAEAFAFLPPAAAARHGAVLGWLGEHLLTLLRRNDAMGMAAGVEARFPYLDEAIVRFGINAPMSAKIAMHLRVGDRNRPFVDDKVVVRRAAARHLPAETATRAKVGFPTHGHDLVRTSPAFWAKGYVVDLLGLVPDAVAHLSRQVVPYHAAKLASVEVFGRLFAFGHDVEQVTDHLRRHVVLAR